MSTEKPSPKIGKSEIPSEALAPQKTEIPADIAAPSDEKGGFKDLGLPEPTRHGDWDVKGRCSDF